MTTPAPTIVIFTVETALIIDGEPTIIWTPNSPANPRLAYRFMIEMLTGAAASQHRDVINQNDITHSIVVKSIDGIVSGNTARFLP